MMQCHYYNYYYYHQHTLPFLIIIFCIFPLPVVLPIEQRRQQQQQQHDDELVERDDVIFPKQYQHEQQQQHLRAHRHHRWRRAPAVWGEPAPDYSTVSLNTSSLSATAFFLYALLFVDLKTSDHYRREHALVKREVMRLANEANSYFFQINIRLLIVDIVQTFRDDLSSLYSFEKYRNQRAAQLPFHNIAVLISHRYAGGLAFIGGMCTARNVMMAGHSSPTRSRVILAYSQPQPILIRAMVAITVDFAVLGSSVHPQSLFMSLTIRRFYPHNPEAMAPIFFHEVAHLIGVPHRPLNETFAIPNCACARAAHKATSALTDDTFRHVVPPPSYSANATAITASTNSALSPMPSKLEEPNQTTTGCLKIPGFDHDCSLQWMVNLLYHERNRCLLDEQQQQLRLNNMTTATTLALCGNGVREAEEQCDCGLSRMCAEWNCVAQNCTLKWPLWMMHLALVFCALLAALFLPLLGWHLFRRHDNNCCLGSTKFNNCLALMEYNSRQIKWRDQLVPTFVRLRHSKQQNKNVTTEVGGMRKMPFWQKFERRHNAINAIKRRRTQSSSVRQWQNLHLLRRRRTNPIRSIWRWMKALLDRERYNDQIMIRQHLRTQMAGDVIRRPIRPPPPPPPLIGQRSTKLPCSLNRPKMPPPPAPQAKLLMQKTFRPTAHPPEPPKPKRAPCDGDQQQQQEEKRGESEDDEWDSD